MTKFEQSTGSLNETLGKKPDDSKSTEAKTEDILANLEKNFDALAKVEQNETPDSPEKNESPSDSPEKNDAERNAAEKILTTAPPLDKKDRPQGLTAGDAMKNIVDQLGLTDKTSRLVQDILAANLTTSDRKTLAKRSPEGAAAVAIASKIETVLGQVNGNAKVIQERAMQITLGQAEPSKNPVIENYSSQVAEQLNQGLPPKEALAYVLVNQMATSFVEGLQENSVQLG